MSQAAPGGAGTTDASARLNLEIEGMKQRAGVGCEVTGISTCDDKRIIFIGTAHVSKVIFTDSFLFVALKCVFASQYPG